ncbi:hypothetical protein FNV43_RR21241 [Rhamnella rubrinervis]|uniref:Uncharacterized protein n=1 Tax=Rhamnella rubrinervis TaxID=2594499 RepID=A0A8K0E2B5_9ROSA|nr:hypothetical protein FNV43_RR21241 [Rhamnella rubrinervis]
MLASSAPYGKALTGLWMFQDWGLIIYNPLTVRTCLEAGVHLRHYYHSDQGVFRLVLGIFQFVLAPKISTNSFSSTKSLLGLGVAQLVSSTFESVNHFVSNYEEGILDPFMVDVLFMRPRRVNLKPSLLELLGSGISLYGCLLELEAVLFKCFINCHGAAEFDSLLHIGIVRLVPTLVEESLVLGQLHKNTSGCLGVVCGRCGTWVLHLESTLNDFLAYILIGHTFEDDSIMSSHQTVHNRSHLLGIGANKGAILEAQAFLGDLGGFAFVLFFLGGDFSAGVATVKSLGWTGTMSPERALRQLALLFILSISIVGYEAHKGMLIELSCLALVECLVLRFMAAQVENQFGPARSRERRISKVLNSIPLSSRAEKIPDSNVPIESNRPSFLMKMYLSFQPLSLVSTTMRSLTYLRAKRASKEFGRRRGTREWKVSGSKFLVDFTPND